MESEFATWLSDQIEKRDLNNAGLGLKIGVSGAAVGRWRQGVNVPNDESVAKLADFFNVSPIELLVLLGRLETDDLEMDVPLSRLIEVAKKLSPAVREDVIEYAIWRHQQETQG